MSRMTGIAHGIYDAVDMTDGMEFQAVNHRHAEMRNRIKHQWFNIGTRGALTLYRRPTVPPLTTLELILGIFVLVLAAAAYTFWLRTRRLIHVSRRFGPEFDRTLNRLGDEDRTESLLHERERRVAKFSIRPLSERQRKRFIVDWNNIQAEFVDDPHTAVRDADELLGDVMQARGYPMSDFEQRAADLSVDHPDVVENYRRGHVIVVRHQNGEAGTEELRQAMIHFRALFDDLVNEPGPHTPRRRITRRSDGVTARD